MAEILDFSSASRRKEESPAPAAGQETELSYDPKEGSVAVTLVTDATGMAHFTVVAPAADVDGVVSSARAALAASFGVRPDDAQGLDAIRQHMGEASFDAFLTTFVQQHFFSKALLRTGIMPFLDPDFLSFDPPAAGQDYTFKVDTLLRPSYELTSYDPVKVDLPEKTEVTSKDVTAYLDRMSEELATWEEDSSRDEVVEGDHVTLNLESSVDGKPVYELTGRHIPFVVGAGVLGEEFDRNIIGCKPRERREFSMSMPAENPDGTMGFQVVQVKMQLDAIQKKVPARIDDAWVIKNMPEAQTLLGLRSRIRTSLEREADAVYREQVMALTAEKLAERLMGEPDERYVEKMRDELVSQFIEGLARQGIDYEQYLSQPGFDRQAWEDEMSKAASMSLRRGLALDSLADHLDINIDEGDIAKVVSQMAPGREEEALQGLVESGQMPRMCEVALRLRANEWLVDQVLKGPRGVVEGGRQAGPSTGDHDRGQDGPKLTLL